MKTRKKVVLLAALYLSQGLPYGFFTQALPVLMRDMGRSLPEIGLANLLALPWALKFAWSPAVDRWWFARLGRRRSWILPLQLATALAMGGIALLDPGTNLPLVLGAFLVANLLAATQDIATDGLAVSLLTPRERGLGNGVQVAGYRVGMILGGGVLLILFDQLGWSGVFTAMAGLLLLATIPIGLHREAPAPLPETSSSFFRTMLQLLQRPGMTGWLAALLTYKFGEALAGGMVRPMLVDLGMEVGAIGWLLGTAGFFAGLLGALAGGWAADRWGRAATVLGMGLVQCVTVGLYALPATGTVTQLPALSALVVVEHFVGGVCTAALFTAMMDRCEEASGGTDYTVQACVVVVSTGTASSLSGIVAEFLGYATHFGLGGGLSLLGLLPVWWAFRRSPHRHQVPA
ncbi:MAG: MFS transporter [Deltaproteobacteria bacterium]|nr:MFS transporter [Deltaproteobacteria bacterium]HCH63987.1 MFS transporter [Deltaproteobacteria bacterium]